MNDFTIPKEFKILGHTIEIIFVDDLIERHSAYGYSFFSNNRIELQTPEKSSLNYDILYQTFWHEVFHFFFILCGL